MKSVIPGWATNYVLYWPSGMQMNNRNSVPENPFRNVQTGVGNGFFMLWGLGNGVLYRTNFVIVMRRDLCEKDGRRDAALG